MRRKDCHGQAATFAARVLRTGSKPEALNLARSYLEVRQEVAAQREELKSQRRKDRALLAMQQERQRHQKQLRLMLARVEFALGDSSLQVKEVSGG